MSDLEPSTPELQSLLSKLPAPVPRAAGASERVLARIEHTLAVAPPPTGGSLGAASTGALTAKLVVPLLLAGAIPAGVAGYLVGRSSVMAPAEVREVRTSPTNGTMNEPPNETTNGAKGSTIGTNGTTHEPTNAPPNGTNGTTNGTTNGSNRTTNQPTNGSNGLNGATNGLNGTTNGSNEATNGTTHAPTNAPTNGTTNDPTKDRPTSDDPSRATGPSALQRSDDGRPLIEAARTALLKSDAKTALELLGEHARKFPASQLAEERSALEIQALLLAGDSAKARQAALAFKATWKNSVFSAVAEAALADGG